MDLPLSNDRRMKVDEFDSGKMLAHASRQAKQRGYDKFPIVDVDSHHYELESFNEILEYMTDPVMKQLAQMANSGNSKGVGVMPGGVGYQDMGGRATRYPLRRIEKPEPGVHRDVSLTRRWMDAMGVDIAVLFPSPMLQLGLHPQVEAEVALSQAYNRWLCERVLAEESRICSMIYLPFNDPDASYRMVKEFAGKKGVAGFMVTSVRYRPVHHNSYMKIYSLIEELGLPLAFHAGYNWNEQSMTHDEQVHLGPCAGLRLVQHGAHDQLGAERAARALPQAQGDLDRERARVAAVHDPAARQRVPDALVGVPGPEEAAGRVHHRHVLHVAADGNPARHEPAGSDLQVHQGGDASCSIRRTIRTGTSTCRRRSTTCRSSRRRPSATSSAATRSSCSSFRSTARSSPRWRSLGWTTPRLHPPPSGR